MNVTSTMLAVSSAVRAIPRGETRTYQEIAQEVGSPSARGISQSLKQLGGRGIETPWWRVVKENGHVANPNPETTAYAIKMLISEGVDLDGEYVVGYGRERRTPDSPRFRKAARQVQSEPRENQTCERCQIAHAGDECW